MRHWTRIGSSILILAGLAIVAGGCAHDLKAEAAASRATPGGSAAVAAAPKELIEAVKRVVTSPPLSLPVESEQDGIVVTGWRPFPGEWHIARRWQERTRYRIEVTPDWNEPLAHSRLTVAAETEQRAASGQRWDREPRVSRPQRAKKMLRQILTRMLHQ